MAQAYAERKAAQEKCAKVCRNAVANGAVSARCAQNKRCLLYIPSFLRHDETFLSGCQVQKSGEKEKRKEKKRGLEAINQLALRVKRRTTNDCDVSGALSNQMGRKVMAIGEEGFASCRAGKAA